MSLKITLSSEDRKDVQKRIRFLKKAINQVIYHQKDPFGPSPGGRLEDLAAERRGWMFVLASSKIKSPAPSKHDIISQMEKIDEEI